MNDRTTRTRLARSACAVALAICMAPNAARARTADPHADAIRSALEASRIRGAAVRVLRADGSVLAVDWGVRDEAGTTVDPATRFRAGSISKLVTSLLALRAARAGVLDLEDRAERWIPDAFATAAPDVPTVRLVHLLEHTAGIAGSNYADYATTTPGAAPGDYVRERMPFALRWPPGRHYSYANGGHTIVAYAIERAWGAPFDRLVEREVLAPLGMSDSDFDASPGTDPTRSLSFDPADGRVVPEWDMAIRPSGALVTTADDLVSLLRMFVARGALEGGSQYLGREALERMERGETSEAARAGARAGSYGLGNFTFFAGGRAFRGHWGRTEGFQSSIGYRPEDGSGFVLLVNTADRAGMAAVREVVATEPVDEADALPAVSSAPVLAFDALPGVFVLHTHSMPMRAWLFALFEAKQLAATADRSHLFVGPALSPLGSTRRFVEDAPGLYRADDVDIATATLATIDGQQFWIDGDSYRRIPTSLYAAQLASLVGGLVAAACVGVAAIVVPLVRRVLGRPQQPRPAPERWLLTAALGLSMLFCLFVRYGLLGTVGATAQLGRPSGIAWAIFAASLAGPAASLATVVHGITRRRTRARFWLAALPMLALSIQLGAAGWIALRTWI